LINISYGHVTRKALARGSKNSIQGKGSQKVPLDTTLRTTLLGTSFKLLKLFKLQAFRGKLEA